MSERLPLSLRTIMELQDTIISALAVMAFLSVPVILGFVLYTTQHIRKDLKREFQSLRKDMRQDMQNLRRDMRQDMQNLRRDMRQDMQSLRMDMKGSTGISNINSRLGRMEGHLFAGHQPDVE